MHTEIETPRLRLRQLVTADIEQLYPILSDPLTMRFWPRPFTRDESCEWIERNLRHYQDVGFGRYAIILKENGMMVGDCGIVPSVVDAREVYDIGYILHHPFWGQGFATEAAAAVRDHGLRTLGLPALHANMAHDHEASRRVAERIGMTKIGEFENSKNRGIRTFLFELRNVQ